MAFGWTALGAAALAVFAWAAGCVLPLALSIAGLSLAGTAVIAGQRSRFTLAAMVVLAGGWWLIWRRRTACAADTSCAPPSRWAIGLLTVATLLTGLTLVWQPLIEPYLLGLLRVCRG